MYEIMDELGLTYDEQNGIIEYKSSESYLINYFLREGQSLLPNQELIKKHLNSALSKFPIYKEIVYRNIGFMTKDEFDAFVLEHAGKNVITYPAFTFASKTINGYVVEAPYLVHYEIESVDGRDVSEIGIKSEKEVLFATDTTFEILSIEKSEKSLIIKMREVVGNGEGKFERTLEERREQRRVQENGSDIENRRTNQEVYSASNTVRGRSAVYDEIYNGTPDSDSTGIDRRSEPQDLGDNTETGNDGKREGLLSGIEENDTRKSVDNEKTIENADSEIETPESVAEAEYTHLYDEEKVSKEYLKSVNPEIENAVISIRNGDLDSVPDVIDVTELDESAIKAISDFVGYDVSGYSCKIERDRLVHIENRHGVNGEHDQSLSDPKDTARMGYVVNNSDSIDWVVDDKGNKVFDTQYNDKNNKPSPVIMLNSKIDGTYCISQAVPDSKKRTVWITSAKIQKAAVGSQVPYDSNATPQLQTSETPLNSSSASNNIISHDDDVVNDSVRTDAENDALNLTDKCEIIATKDAATGNDIWVVTLKDRISSDEYKTLRAKVKSVGGWYSQFAKTPDGKSIPGFVFKNKPTKKL